MNHLKYKRFTSNNLIIYSFKKLHINLIFYWIILQEKTFRYNHLLQSVKDPLLVINQLAGLN